MGIRGILVLGLLTASACADRGRGTDRGSGRTSIVELNNEDGDRSAGDSGVSTPDDPPITVMGDGDVGYQAYQSWLAIEGGLVGPVCECAVSFGAYASNSECQVELAPPREDACIASFTRSHAEGAAALFDCLSGASTRFGSCLRSQTCFDQTDYQRCADAYNSEFEGCLSSLTETENSDLTACSNG